uniref:Uncharacterized protein n=1 Tax=Gopherus evgoodei TaxID=1825980 RepID=A0A8C4YGR3_9SAUR
SYKKCFTCEPTKTMQEGHPYAPGNELPICLRDRWHLTALLQVMFISGVAVPFGYNE